MVDIQVYNKIADEGLEIFADNNYTLNQTDNPDAVILRSQDLHHLEMPDNLLGVARAGAGVNNIPVEECSEKGVVVFNTPGANANAVGELVISSLIMSVRHMISANRWVEGLRGNGESFAQQVEAGKKKFKGTEIKRKTLGVIGLGSVGHLVANAAIDLGMKIVGYDPYIKKDALDKLNYHIERTEDITELYQKADFITIHVPAVDENHHLVGEEALTQMKDNVVLVNFSRDTLVNEEAVIKALDDNKVATYVTDFPNENLAKRKDCIVFPHLGASTLEAEKTCAMMAAEQLTEFLELGVIKNSVNFPDVEMSMEAPTRFAIVNRNVPNMITLLVNEIGSYEINIERFINKSRGDYAYTLIDIDEEDPEVLTALQQAIDAEENILSARLIKNPKS